MSEKDDSLEIKNTSQWSAPLKAQQVSINSIISTHEKWFILAGGLAIAAIFIFLSFICWIKIRHKTSEKMAENKVDIIDVEKGCVKRYTSSSDSSVDTTELPKDLENVRPSNLIHSLSFDVNTPFILRKHSVQPGVIRPRWNSLNATGIADLNGSDSDDVLVKENDTGKLWFSLSYDEKESNLCVTLIRAKYLPARGFSKGSRDPFVKIYLLPDEENFQQSKVRKRTLSPKFNEVFKFQVPKEECINRSLRFSIYDMDKKKVRHCLGHVVVALNEVDLTSNLIFSRELNKIAQCKSVGQLQVALACNPFNNKLKVTIVKGKNLDTSRYNEPFTIYMKVELFHGQKLLKAKQTLPRNLLGPTKSDLIVHEAMTFSVPAKFYDSCYLKITVFISEINTKKDTILGKINFGSFLYARGENLLHWQEMISNPRTMVKRWHTLELIT